MVLVIVLTSIALPATWRKRRGRPVSRCTTQVRRTSSPAWPLWLLIAVTGRRQESDGPAGSTRMPSVSPRLPTRRRPSSRPSTTGGRPVGTRRRETRRASCPRRGHCALSAPRRPPAPGRALPSPGRRRTSPLPTPVDLARPVHHAAEVDQIPPRDSGPFPHGSDDHRVLVATPRRRG